MERSYGVTQSRESVAACWTRDFALQIDRAEAIVRTHTYEVVYPYQTRQWCTRRAFWAEALRRHMRAEFQRHFSYEQFMALRPASELGLAKEMRCLAVCFDQALQEQTRHRVDQLTEAVGLVVQLARMKLTAEQWASLSGVSRVQEGPVC